ncbi:hypothetical protein [Streptomyces sp. SYSU K217416]
MLGFADHVFGRGLAQLAPQLIGMGDPQPVQPFPHCWFAGPLVQVLLRQPGGGNLLVPRRVRTAPQRAGHDQSARSAR